MVQRCVEAVRGPILRSLDETSSTRMLVELVITSPFRYPMIEMWDEAFGRAEYRASREALGAGDGSTGVRVDARIARWAVPGWRCTEPCARAGSPASTSATPEGARLNGDLPPLVEPLSGSRPASCAPASSCCPMSSGASRTTMPKHVPRLGDASGRGLCDLRHEYVLIVRALAGSSPRKGRGASGGRAPTLLSSGKRGTSGSPTCGSTSLDPGRSSLDETSRERSGPFPSSWPIGWDCMALGKGRHDLGSLHGGTRCHRGGRLGRGTQRGLGGVGPGAAHSRDATSPAVAAGVREPPSTAAPPVAIVKFASRVPPQEAPSSTSTVELWLPW